MIFILGSPRTGSTLLYQLLIKTYNLSYFNNMTNAYFYHTPYIGFYISRFFSPKISFQSDHGKTKGLLGPSEASKFFSYWFGGQNKIIKPYRHFDITEQDRISNNKNPLKANNVNSRFKTSNKIHTPYRGFDIVNTFNSINRHIRSDLITKNAWNCFRIKLLTQLFPDIKFIWIRRDIIQSAASDLNARYLRGGPYIWNSAYTHDFKDIIRRPYWEQVVEQQYSYNKTIEDDLIQYCPNDNYIEIWYEDMCSHPNECLESISQFLNLKIYKPLYNLSSKKREEGDDLRKISNYVGSNQNKFEGYMK